jgi:hypothetical protein
VPLTSRLLADRRGGVDRRAVPRRTVLALVRVDRRRVVDLRRGAERRSTLDRRNATARPRATETPAEHVRNALQLLHHLHETDGLHVEHRADLAAALRRLQRALELLERRTRS